MVQYATNAASAPCRMIDEPGGVVSRLSGAEVDCLSALLTDTLSEDDLEVVVYVSTGDRLYDEFVGSGLPLRRTIRDLLIQLEKSGLTASVLRRVYEIRPKRPDVRAEIARHFPEAARPSAPASADLSIQTAGVAQANAPDRAVTPGLQRNVRPRLAKLDIQVWVERLAQIERQVCRIEQGEHGLGTGFLVGPEVVLTNWHVVEGAIKAGTLGRVACRFDYLRMADTSRQPGVVVTLHADGCLDARPYAPSEVTGTPGLPEPDPSELDYALLRLEQRDTFGRGWVTLPMERVQLDAGAPILIVQHPDGGPMKLALDTDAVIGRNSNGTRVRYATNTDPGSSGSPCFTMDWDLAALHHLGDPAWQAPSYNEGVPAELIRNSIVQRGHGAWLGGPG